MQKKMYSFLRSIGIESPERFDMDFTLVGRNPHRVEQIDMFVQKETPWDYGALEEFLAALGTIRYPYSLRFSYVAEIGNAHVLPLYEGYSLAHVGQGALPSIRLENGVLKVAYSKGNRQKEERTVSDLASMLSFSNDAPYWYKDVTAKGYPIVLTRDMDKARQWLRSKARGSQQTGVLVSKVAARFKPLAVNILAQGDENAVHWFLEDKTDVRSSNYLEDAATEIQVQGLELDFVCVLWDADMRYNDGHWEFFIFNGKNKWTPVANTPNGQEEKKYMLNAYRVLLTRARQGIVICVPKGNSRLTPEGFPEDLTRLPAFYDGRYAYLKSLGIEEI